MVVVSASILSSSTSADNGATSFTSSAAADAAVGAFLRRGGIVFSCKRVKIKRSVVPNEPNVKSEENK